ncbi:MAG: phosphoribosylanthranilate isomerase [Clostridiales bacterium]|nr:phosphoribosylanthranilate isomerase [Clostridiales bacterium]
MKIKICGLTQPQEAEYLNRNPVDFAGFVLFFPKSKRNITIDRAKEIMNLLSPAIARVAVVVSPTVSQLSEIQGSGFDYVQIHGDFPLENLAGLKLPVLRAISAGNLREFPAWQACPKVAGFVFDAQEPGSGKVFDWNLLGEIPRDERLFLLAGGLNPENVQKAIQAVHPDGVDVSSGVEFDGQIPGKDPRKINAFVEAVGRTIF